MKAVRLTVVTLGAAIFGVLALEGAIHWEEWLLPGDRGHSATAESTRTPAPSAPSRRSRDGSNEHTPRGHQGLIHGTKGDDVLKGTDAGERIDGLAGRDQVIAGSGDDVLIGGADNDLLMGGPHDDTYIIEHHGGGADVIVEESGTDSLQLLGGRLALGSIEFLRHGDDLLNPLGP